jgi:hypothetical protein
MLKIRTLTICLPTPRAGIQLAGYATRRVLTAISRPLYASFIAFEDIAGNEVVLGSIDTLFISPQLTQDLRAAGVLGNLILFSTHTHNAPSLARELPMLGEVDDDWYNIVVERLSDAVTTLRHSEPVKVSMSYGEHVTSLNVNRRKRQYVLNYPKLLDCRIDLRRVVAMTRNIDGPVDPRVRLFSFDSPLGTRAVLWSFAAHAAFVPGYTTVSPDFPGLVHEELRKTLGPDCCLVYMPGLAGSAIPNAKQQLLMPPRELLMRILPFLPMLPSYSEKGYTFWVRELTGELTKAYQNRLSVDCSGGLEFRKCMIRSIFTDHARGQQLDLEASYLGLGEGAGVLAYSGEMLGEWLEHFDHLPLDRVMLSGYAGGPCLYVPPTKLLEEGGYEVDRFQQYFGLAGNFRADITDRVVEATEGILYHGDED